MNHYDLLIAQYELDYRRQLLARGRPHERAARQGHLRRRRSSVRRWLPVRWQDGVGGPRPA